MRNAAWGGSAQPTGHGEASKRLVAAAWRCIDRFGPQRTNVADIAAEAGVTRQTIYRYFGRGEDLLRAAFVMAAGGIVERMIAHARTFPHPGDRIVEAMVFLWREIPTDPHLGPVFVSRGTTSPDGLRLSEAVLDVSRSALRTLNDQWAPLTPREVDELAELMVRLLKSFLTDRGPKRLSAVALRRFLHRWLIPATRLPTRTETPSRRVAHALRGDRTTRTRVPAKAAR